MNIQELKESRFLSQRDVDPPVCWRIQKVGQINVALPGAEPDYQWAVWFREFEKPMVLKPTNAGLIAEITNSEETDDWPDTLIVLYKDPNIMYGNKKVGGIRVRAPKEGYEAPEPSPETGDNIPF